jgi:hypothetical protein
MNAVDDVGPLADPVAETRRLIAAAAEQRLLLRALGGVAVYLLAPDGKPRLPRRVKDIDVAVPRGSGRPAARLLEEAGYVGDQMFNALHGSRRLLFIDPAHERHLDVFVGEFSMCHEIPLTARLDRAPLTVPPEELLLSKLQIVEATANDQSRPRRVVRGCAMRQGLGPVADLRGQHRAAAGQLGEQPSGPGRGVAGPGAAGGAARLPGGRTEDHEVAAAQPGRRQGALVPAAGRGAGPGGWDPAMSASCPEAGDVR